MFYNATKGGVDTFDWMCSQQSCSRKTRRWPLCVFYGMVNIAMNNSYIVYSHRPVNKNILRRKFGTALAIALCRPHANIRLQQARYLPREVVSSILSVFDLPDPVATTSQQQKSDKRHRCKICPSSATFRGKVLCIKCQKAMCPRHTCQLCINCYNNE